MSNAKDRAKEIALKGYTVSGLFHAKTFDRDFAVFMTTRKMIDRFLRKGQINEKLLINNIVVTLNVFGPKSVTHIFRILLNDEQYSVAKAVLIFLKQYDWSRGSPIQPNRIVVDILKDMSQRYCINHL